MQPLWTLYVPTILLLAGSRAFEQDKFNCTNQEADPNVLPLPSASALTYYSLDADGAGYHAVLLNKITESPDECYWGLIASDKKYPKNVVTYPYRTHEFGEYRGVLYCDEESVEGGEDAGEDGGDDGIDNVIQLDDPSITRQLQSKGKRSIRVHKSSKKTKKVKKAKTESKKDFNSAPFPAWNECSISQGKQQCQENKKCSDKPVFTVYCSDTLVVDPVCKRNPVK
jgi:hypothetical protein